MSGYERRPLLWAFVGPLASHVIEREYGRGVEEWAAKFERVGDMNTARQLREAVSQMRESARLRNERQREIEDSGDYGMPKTGEGAVSSCPPPGTLMDSSVVAGQLGVDVRTVTGWCEERKLPATRGPGRGRPWLIDPADLADFVDRRQG